MRREHDWSAVSEIATDRNVCIRVGGVNHPKAERDFKANPDKVRYYSFQLDDKSRGYMRFIKDNNHLYLDFASPFGNNITANAIAEFTRRMSRVATVVIPSSNLPEGVKRLVQIETPVDLDTVTAGLEHATYVVGKARVVSIIKGK